MDWKEWFLSVGHTKPASGSRLLRALRCQSTGSFSGWIEHQLVSLHQIFAPLSINTIDHKLLMAYESSLASPELVIYTCPIQGRVSLSSRLLAQLTRAY